METGFHDGFLFNAPDADPGQWVDLELLNAGY